jgi:peptidyl-prolyl cis-trans isomerase D
MSTLSRIRQNIGLIAIVIFIALVSFILTDFLQGITTLVQGIPEAGIVAGEDVSDQSYQERVNLYMQNQNGTPDELQACQLRTQAWQAIVQERVYEEALDEVGLKITGEELYAMFEEVSPLVRQILGIPPQQQIEPNQIKRYLDQLLQQSPDQLALIEDIMAQQRGSQRYLNMLSACYVGSSTAAARAHQNSSRKVDLSFLGVNFTAIPDSTIPVSDSELRSYMREHEEQYQQEAQTFIRYARFKLTPTRGDSIKAYDNLARQRENFAAVLNDSTYTIGKSRQPYRPRPVPVYQLPQAIRDSVVGAAPKTVFGPVLQGGYYQLFKLVEVVDSAEAGGAKINHILFSGDSTVEAEARQVAAQARGGADFGELAAEYSDDFNSKNKGGSLGWYRKGQFGPDFDEAIESASVGSIVGPIKGPGGYHVVQIVDRTDQAYDVARIEEEIIYSKSTRDSVYGVANQFAAQLIGSGDINRAASEAGVNAFESNPLTKSTCDVLGLNGGRELVVWALSSEEGDVSRKVFNVNDNFVIAQVTRKIEEGLQDLEAVREEVTRAVRNEKKGEMIREKLASLAGQDLNAMKNGYGTGAFINTAQGINFDSNSIPGVGADPKLVGTAVGLGAGETSAPVVGNNGVYVLQVTNVNEAEALPEAQLQARARQLATSGQQQMQNRINAALIEMAKVEDNRIEGEKLRYSFK